MQADAEMQAIGASGEATILTLGFDKAEAQCCKLLFRVFACVGTPTRTKTCSEQLHYQAHTHTQTGLGLTMERLLEEVASHCTPARELEDQLVLRPWPGHGAPGLCSLPCSVVGNAEFTVIAVWCYFVLTLRRQRRA